jgi:hypothetical protein
MKIYKEHIVTTDREIFTAWLNHVWRLCIAEQTASICGCTVVQTSAIRWSIGTCTSADILWETPSGEGVQRRRVIRTDVFAVDAGECCEMDTARDKVVCQQR